MNSIDTEFHDNRYIKSEGNNYGGLRKRQSTLPKKRGWRGNLNYWHWMSISIPLSSIHTEFHDTQSIESEVTY